MDVRFCESRNHGREAHVRAGNLVHTFLRAPPKRASGEVCFLLTSTPSKITSLLAPQLVWE
jgi:hypothetical protein